MWFATSGALIVLTEKLNHPVVRILLERGHGYAYINLHKIFNVVFVFVFPRERQRMPADLIKKENNNQCTFFWWKPEIHHQTKSHSPWKISVKTSRAGATIKLRSFPPLSNVKLGHEQSHTPLPSHHTRVSESSRTLDPAGAVNCPEGVQAHTNVNQSASNGRVNAAKTSLKTLPRLPPPQCSP